MSSPSTNHHVAEVVTQHVEHYAFGISRSDRHYFTCTCGVNGILRKDFDVAVEDKAAHLEAARQQPSLMKGEYGFAMRAFPSEDLYQQMIERVMREARELEEAGELRILGDPVRTTYNHMPYVYVPAEQTQVSA